jgi:hypothetical protein
MERLRRTFAKRFAVLDREAPQFQEAKTGRNFGDGHAFAVRGQKGAPRLGQPYHSKLPARRKTANPVESLAKRSLAYLKGTAQHRNVLRLVQMCESQSLRLFDEIAARVAFPSERRFRNGSEPLMNVHGKPPVR